MLFSTGTMVAQCVGQVVNIAKNKNKMKVNTRMNQLDLNRPNAITTLSKVL